MLREYFIDLFQYDLWANETAADVLRPLYEPDGRLARLFCHIINAQMRWMQRIQADDFGLTEIWATYDFDEALDRLQQANREWTDYLTALSDEELTDWISYTDTKGTPYENQVQDIVTQLLFHGAYHRAQIAADVKARNLTPPVTDYIAYVRQKQLL